MSTFLLEFIDSDFMKGVFYLGVFLVVLAVLGAAALLWWLTRHYLRWWRGFRAAPQPVPVSQRLVSLPVLLPLLLLLVFGLKTLLAKVHLQRGKAAAYQALAGHYSLADTLMPGSTQPTTADTAALRPVQADLFLHSDGTFSYHSTIPTDATLDTVGTWDFKRDWVEYQPVFHSASQFPIGLWADFGPGGDKQFFGAYLKDNNRLSFKLKPVKKKE